MCHSPVPWRLHLHNCNFIPIGGNFFFFFRSFILSKPPPPCKCKIIIMVIHRHLCHNIPKSQENMVLVSVLCLLQGKSIGGCHIIPCHVCLINPSNNHPNLWPSQTGRNHLCKTFRILQHWKTCSEAMGL